MEYSEQPVLFLEQDVDDALGYRNWRWWAAFEGDRAVLPEAMVSSGHQVDDGSIIFSGDTFDDHYRGMVQAELSRAPQADIEAYVQRAGDMLQAAPAGPGTFTLTPGAITFLVDERGRHTGPVDLHLRGVFEGWVAMQHPDWITVSPGSGTLNDKPIVSLAGETLSPGWQHGDIELLVTGVAGEAWTEYVAVSVYQGTVYHAYLPVVR